MYSSCNCSTVQYASTCTTNSFLHRLLYIQSCNFLLIAFSSGVSSGGGGGGFRGHEHPHEGTSVMTSVGRESLMPWLA